MDYSLAAIKVFGGQLKHSQPLADDPTQSTTATGPSSMTLGNLLFQRAWLQGLLVSGTEEGCWLLDDGSSIVELLLPKDFQKTHWKAGMYVMAVGAYAQCGLYNSAIKVHKLVDLSNSPDREAMWNLEVIEAYEMFYKSFMEV